VNLFVAGFIGSPAMNLMEAQLSRADDGDSVVVELAEFRLPLPDEVLAERPALRGFVGQKVVPGIRPEDMEDASLVSDAPASRRISATVDLREALGSDVVVHFRLATPPAMTEDVKELVQDAGVEDIPTAQRAAEGGTATVLARLNPRTNAKIGQQIDLVVDTHRLHFFDPNGGLGIYGKEGG
jgi:multiple sugar transport system ATP-binding protein